MYCWLSFFVSLIFSFLMSTSCIVAQKKYENNQLEVGGSSYIHTAYLNISFLNPVTRGAVFLPRKIEAHFGANSLIAQRFGVAIHARTANNSLQGCSKIVNMPTNGEKWIAVIQRGGCSFSSKIRQATIIQNATAVVIYDNEEKHDFLMRDVEQTVSVCISKADGDYLGQLIDNGTQVVMKIEVGKPRNVMPHNINKTSVLFVSISFIVLMIISLAWLVFYYIQRFRYAHAKERLSRRLMSAAKKAITKMPVRTVKSGDKETESDFDQCAVCIEGYKSTDVIRILPCKHLFHKSCVDPWLIEQRSCPMCKLDILKAYGLQIQNSCDSVNIQAEGMSGSVGGTTEQVNSRPTVEILRTEDEAPNNDIVRSGTSSSSTPSRHPSESARECSVMCANNNSIENINGDQHAENSTCALVIPISVKSLCESMESIHSIDSELSELQSLMPASDGVPPGTGITTSASIHGSQHSLKDVSTL